MSFNQFYLKLFISLILFLTTLFFPSIKATTYPFVQMNHNDLKIIDNPYREAFYRLQLVEHAIKTIDIITYDQRADAQMGLPLLLALKEAANRGVKVRLLSAWMSSILKDPYRMVEEVLSEKTKEPIDFHIIGGPKMMLYGWGLFDGVHEKLFIVDGKVAIITGRGHAAEYFKWLDVAYTFKGPLVNQVQKAFENLWTSLKQEGFFEGGRFLKKPNLFHTLPKLKQLPLTQEDESFVTNLMKWEQQPERAIDESNEFYMVRLLHFNLIEQLSILSHQKNKKPSHFSQKKRLLLLEDPIIDEVIRILEDPLTKDFSFYALITTFHPKLKQAFIKAIKRGVHITLVTNGKNAHKSVAPLGLPLGWFTGLYDLVDIWPMGIKIFLLEQKDPTATHYVHKKLILSGEYTIFGSHNLSLPSSYLTDEMNIEVFGSGFVNQVRNIFFGDIEDKPNPLLKEAIYADITHDLKKIYFTKACRYFITPLY